MQSEGHHSPGFRFWLKLVSVTEQGAYNDMVIITIGNYTAVPKSFHWAKGNRASGYVRTLKESYMALMISMFALYRTVPS